jgi:hypothetical protein
MIEIERGEIETATSPQARSHAGDGVIERANIDRMSVDVSDGVITRGIPMH